MLEFMKNKILIPILITGALAAFFSFRYSGAFDNQNDERKNVVMETIRTAIGQGHFQPRPLDDSFSAIVFKKTFN